MARRATNKAALASEAWRDIFDFIVATAGERNKLLADRGLTPNDSRALTSLDEHAGRTLRSLADEWRCDASTATWIVDRLETRGLAERRAHPSDRRARLVVLTTAGAKTRAELMAGIYTPPPELLQLKRVDLALLREAVANLPTAERRRRPARRPREVPRQAPARATEDSGSPTP